MNRAWTPAAAGGGSLVIPQQFLVEIHHQMDLVHSDVLVFAVDRAVLLFVDVNGRKADDRIGKVGKPPGVRACREDKGCRRCPQKRYTSLLL